AARHPAAVHLLGERLTLVPVPGARARPGAARQPRRAVARDPADSGRQPRAALARLAAHRLRLDPALDGRDPGRQAARSVTARFDRAARIAGGSPPIAPMIIAKTSPTSSRSGVTRNANDRCENVCQFIVPVVSPLIGRTARQPTIPPTSAIHI